MEERDTYGGLCHLLAVPLRQGPMHKGPYAVPTRRVRRRLGDLLDLKMDLGRVALAGFLRYSPCHVPGHVPCAVAHDGVGRLENVNQLAASTTIVPTLVRCIKPVLPQSTGWWEMRSW